MRHLSVAPSRAWRRATLPAIAALSGLVALVGAAGAAAPTIVTATFNGGPALPVDTGDILVEASATDADADLVTLCIIISELTGPSLTFECIGGPAAASYSHSAAISLEGSYEVTIEARDALSAVTSTTTASFVYDKTPPLTQIDSGPSNPSSSSMATFTFSGSDALSAVSFECAVDAAAFAACTSPTTVGPLGDGPHTFSVRAIDGAGLADPTPASQSWTIVPSTIDTTAPDTSLTSTPAAFTNSNAASFAFTGADNLTATADLTFECSVDGLAFGACTSPASVSGLRSGDHTFAVRAIDAAGNVDATPATYVWTIDTVAPACKVVLNPTRHGGDAVTVDLSATSKDRGGSGVASVVLASIAASDGSASFSGQTIGGTLPQPVTFQGLKGRTFAITYTVTDNAGNVASCDGTLR